MVVLVSVRNRRFVITSLDAKLELISAAIERHHSCKIYFPNLIPSVSFLPIYIFLPPSLSAQAIKISLASFCVFSVSFKASFSCISVPPALLGFSEFIRISDVFFPTVLRLSEPQFSHLAVTSVTQAHRWKLSSVT